MSQYTELNVEEAKKQAEKLDGIAKTMQETYVACKEEMETLRQNWSGESADKYLAKLEKCVTFLQKSAEIIAGQAKTLEGVAAAIKKGEGGTGTAKP